MVDFRRRPHKTLKYGPGSVLLPRKGGREGGKEGGRKGGEGVRSHGIFLTSATQKRRQRREEGREGVRFKRLCR